jgi:hypothetical protein
MTSINNSGVKMNRRSFLRVAFTATAVTAVPVTLAAALETRIPVIYGDGKHDDWEGLQAALDGREFACRDGCVRAHGRNVSIIGGTYRISKPLRLPASEGSYTTIISCEFIGNGFEFSARMLS